MVRQNLTSFSFGFDHIMYLYKDDHILMISLEESLGDHFHQFLFMSFSFFGSHYYFYFGGLKSNEEGHIHLIVESYQDPWIHFLVSLQVVEKGTIFPN